MLKKSFILILLTCYISHALADVNFVDRPDVKTFIHRMVVQHHFSQEALLKIFEKVKIRPKVVKSINAPLEQKPWYAYQMLFVSEWRIREGVIFWKKYQKVLDRAEKTYGVPASIIVATIGIETKYGRSVGNYRVMDALTNLAFSNTPRASYFRSELEQFLLLAREQKMNPLRIMGSYAGAIGQPQFMPSSYRHYAVDFSGNSKIDLSNDEIDVIGSIANYYHKHGWQLDKPVAVPASFQAQHNLYRDQYDSAALLKADLTKYGITANEKLDSKEKVKIIRLQNYLGSEYWLGLHNFYVIKKYNNSDLYAMAVYQLSHYIAVLKERENNA